MTRIANNCKGKEELTKNTLFQKIFNEIVGYKIQGITETEQGTIEIKIASKASSYKCPHCGKRSHTEHSKYERVLLTQPVSGKSVKLIISSRRFRCNNKKCPHPTFAEQFASLAAPYARRTHSLTKMMQDILVFMTATSGSKAMAKSGIKLSISTCLRIVRGIDISTDKSQPTFIGIDDFAYKKGIHYGTIIVDHETRKALQLLSTRNTKDVAKELEGYSNVEIATMDRSKLYAQAVASSLPKACRIIDRFHLVQNCCEAIYNTLKKNMADITKELSLQPAVNTLHTTVENPDAMNLEAGVTDLDAIFEPYFSTINEGIKNLWAYKYLYNNLVNQGLSYPYIHYYRWMKQKYSYFDPKKGINRPQKPKQTEKEKEDLWKMKLLSSHKLQYYLINTEYGVNKKTGECSKERLTINQFISESKTMTYLQEFYTSFRNSTRSDCQNGIDDWISKYKTTHYKDLRSFVKGLIPEVQTIKQSIVSKYSNGLVEGLNNKLKALKRSMYGRAGPSLLAIKLINS